MRAASGRGQTFALTQTSTQQINASVDAAQNKSTASLQTSGITCSIRDCDSRNNANLCALSGGGS